MKNFRYWLPLSVAALLVGAGIYAGPSLVGGGGTTYTATAPVDVTGSVISMSAASAATSGYVTNSAGLLVVDAGFVSTVASGGTAYLQQTGAKHCLETGGASCISSDGTTISITKKISVADDITTAGSLIVGTNQSVRLGTAGILQGVNPFLVATSFTLTSGFCTSPTVVSPKVYGGTFSIGSSCTGITTGVVGLPSANVGWNCSIKNMTTPASFIPQQTATTTASATFTNYSRTTGIAADWTASDVHQISCIGY